MGKNEYTLCRNFIFAITGKVNYFANREELVNYIESEGGKVGSSVTANTDFLINNNIDNQSEKNKKAKELGVQIITEKQFLELFGGDYVEEEDDESSNTITVECLGVDEKALADLLLNAYTEMILNGMGLGYVEIETGLNPQNAVYKPLTHDSKRFIKARETLTVDDCCEIEMKKGRATLQTSSADDAAFVLANVLKGKNSYSDHFGNDDSSLLHIAKAIKEVYPNAMINGDMEFQGSGYYYIEYIKSENDKIQIWNSDDSQIRIIDVCKKDLPPILKAISEMETKQLYSALRLYGVNPETEDIIDNSVADTWEGLLDFFVKQDIDNMYDALCKPNKSHQRNFAIPMTRKELLNFFDSTEESILEFGDFFDRSIEYGLKYLEQLKNTAN